MVERASSNEFKQSSVVVSKGEVPVERLLRERLGLAVQPSVDDMNFTLARLQQIFAAVLIPSNLSIERNNLDSRRTYRFVLSISSRNS